MILLEWLFRHPLVQPVGWALVHFLWQGAAVAGLLALLIRTCTPRGAPLLRSAEHRYLAGCAALLLMAACPVVTLVHLLPDSYPSVSPLQAPGITSHPAVVERDLALPSPGLGLPDPDGPSRIGRVQPLLPGFVAVWLLGVLVLSVRLVGGWVVVQRLGRRGARPTQGDTRARFLELTQRLRIRRPVRLLESVEVPVPTVIGWLRAAVLVPVGALAGLPPQQLEALLAHELAHIRRHDYLVNLLQTGVETVLFYHPAVWWVSHSIRLERENCCDDLVVAVLGDRLTYARALTSLEELGRVPGPLVLAATNSGLLPRVRRILGLPPVSAGLSATGVGGMIVITLILAAVLGASAAKPVAPTERVPVAAVVGAGAGTLSVPADAKAKRQRELVEQARSAKARRKAFLMQVKHLEVARAKPEQESAAAARARTAEEAKRLRAMAEAQERQIGTLNLMIAADKRLLAAIQAAKARRARREHSQLAHSEGAIRQRAREVAQEQAARAQLMCLQAERARMELTRRQLLQRSKPGAAGAEEVPKMKFQSAKVEPNHAELPQLLQALAASRQAQQRRLQAGNESSVLTALIRAGASPPQAGNGTGRKAGPAKPGSSNGKGIVKGAPGRSIQDVTVLDLRGVPPSHVAKIRSIKDVVVVLLDEKNRNALNASMEDVQATVVVGPNARVMVEPFLEFSRAALEGMPARQQLVLVGVVYFKPDVTPALVNQKFASLNVTGVVLASEGARGALLGKMQITGTSVVMPDDAGSVVHSVGSTQITTGYLERLADQSVYVNIGSTEIAADVAEMLLAQKIRSYVNIGETTGPKPLLDLLKSRSAANIGAFEAAGEKEKGGG
jgi:beta-lactamase regulating signal transducer with metallopeptidase domain